MAALTDLTSIPLADLIQQGTHVRYATLASWIFLVWDYVVTFDQEVDLFWAKNGWSWAKFLFLLNRYTSLLFLSIHTFVLLSHDVSGDFCRRWFQFQGWTGAFTILLVELILQFRLYALYDRSKVLLCFMIVAFVAEITAMASVLGTTYYQLDATSMPIAGSHYRVCVPLNVPNYFFSFWLIALFYEALLFSLAVYKGSLSFQIERYHDGQIRSEDFLQNLPGAQDDLEGGPDSLPPRTAVDIPHVAVHSSGSAIAVHGSSSALSVRTFGGNSTVRSRSCATTLKSSVWKAWNAVWRSRWWPTTWYSSSARVLDVLIRDSIVYFFFVLLADLANALVWMKGSPVLLELMVGFGLAIPTVMGNRLLINLRTAYFRVQDTTWHEGAAIVTRGTYPDIRRRRPVDEFDTQWAMNDDNDEMGIEQLSQVVRDQSPDHPHPSPGIPESFSRRFQGSWGRAPGPSRLRLSRTPPPNIIISPPPPGSQDLKTSSSSMVPIVAFALAEARIETNENEEWDDNGGDPA